MHRTLLFLLFLLSLSGSAFAESASQPKRSEGGTEVQNLGIRDLASNYQIFPTGQPGNSLYQEGQRLLSKPGLVILGVIPSKLGSLVWGETEGGKREAHWVSKDKSQVEVRAFGESVFFVKLPGGVTRLFWVGPQGKSADLLPHSNTAANFAYNGVSKGAFSHISGGSKIQTEGGRIGYQYSFKVHTVNLKTGKVTHHQKVYLSLRPSLKLRWVRDNLLQIRGGQSPPEQMKIR